jgi:hypothetical protein
VDKLVAFLAAAWAVVKKALPFLEGMYVQYLRDNIRALQVQASASALNQQIRDEMSGASDDLETLSDGDLADRLRDAAAKRKPLA